MVKLKSLILLLCTASLYAMPFPEEATGNAVSRFITGFGGAASSMVSGLFGIVAHPIETAKNIGHAIAHPIKTVKAIASHAKDSWERDKASFLG